jgi:signal transduction histidine kinase
MHSRKIIFVRERPTLWAVLVVTIASYISIALTYDRYTPMDLVILVLIGIIHTCYQVKGWSIENQTKLGLFFYFGIQILLTSVVLYWTKGATFLLMMPIPSIAICLLPMSGAIVVGSLVVVVETWVWGLGLGWAGIGQEFLMSVSSVFFVMAFTQVAVKEKDVRKEAERLAEELGEANQKLREYAVQAEELAAAKERNRISREIHDSLGHYLTAIHMQINAAKAVFDQDANKALDAMNKAQSLALDSLAEVRRAVAALRITPLEGKQLIHQIQELVDASNVSGICTTFQVIGEERHLEAPVELALYRVVQEGLTNVRKHSCAKNAAVVLDFSQPGFTRLTIKDDGNGAVADKPSGFGLIGLRERLNLCGGRLTIASAEGTGFSLEAEVPG